MPPKLEKRMARARARSSVVKTPSCMASMVSPMSWCQQITSSRESSGMGYSSSDSPVMADHSMSSRSCAAPTVAASSLQFAWSWFARCARSLCTTFMSRRIFVLSRSSSASRCASAKASSASGSPPSPSCICESESPRYFRVMMRLRRSSSAGEYRRRFCSPLHVGRNSPRWS